MKFLRKLLIKDYNNVDDPKVRFRYGKVSNIIGIFTNLLLFLAKLFIGILSASITILIDSVNSLTDAGSCVLSLIGFKLSTKPADQEHPYGHARYEYIMALIVALISLAVGVIFAESCIEKIITPTTITLSISTFIILGAGIIIKLFQTLMYKSFAKAIDSDSLKANGADAFFDMITSIAILISIAVMAIFKINIDGIIGLIASVIIIISAFKLILETINPLLSEKPEKKLIDKIGKEILTFSGIEDYHDLIIHTYGNSVIFATVHVEVPSDTTLLKSHELIDQIERHFEDKLNINITIQVDPVDKTNLKTSQIHDRIERLLQQNLNSEIQIHALRVINKKDTIKVLFDIEETYGRKLNKKEVINLLTKEFSEEKKPYTFVFTIDHPFT